MKRKLNNILSNFAYDIAQMKFLILIYKNFELNKYLINASIIKK